MPTMATRWAWKINTSGGGRDCSSLPTTAMCLNAGAMGRQDAESETLIPTSGGCFDVTHSLRAEGFDASEDGTGRGTPIVPVAIPINTQLGLRGSETSNSTREGIGIGQEGDPSFTLQSAHSHAVAFDLRGREGGSRFEGPHDTANIRAAAGGSSRSYVASMQVRRLTPRECERLQGFPDDYTLIPYRNGLSADGPRYKALGNSMAVPVMRWIGERIQKIDNIMHIK